MSETGSPTPRPTPPTIRAATRDDARTLSALLARAFWDDPVWRWLCPDDATSERRLELAFRAYVNDALRHATVFTTPDLGGAALWRPPGSWRVGFGAMLRATPLLLRAFGGRTPEAMQTERAVERQHPSEPHWYLSVLGTDPPAQGRGIGGALIRQVTDRCDHLGIPAYLESSKAENVPYYERFGFAVTGDTRLGDDGPPIWFMWRDPR